MVNFIVPFFEKLNLEILEIPMSYPVKDYLEIKNGIVLVHSKLYERNIKLVESTFDECWFLVDFDREPGLWEQKHCWIPKYNKIVKYDWITSHKITTDFRVIIGCTKKLDGYRGLSKVTESMYNCTILFKFKT